MKPYCLLLTFLLPLAAQVKVEQGDNRIIVHIDGKPYGTLYYGPDTMKPYMYPLRAASGKIVTRGYPMETIAGESTDHPHHRGLWFGHGDVNGFTFWDNEVSQKTPKTGHMTFKKVEGLTSGKKSGSLAIQFEWQDVNGKPLLRESRKMIFYTGAQDRILDFDANLTAIETAKFGDTKEGIFAIRLASALEEPSKDSLPSPRRTGAMTSSTGGRTEKQIWGKQAEWVDYSGDLEGEKLGIAILDHPENFRHPTYWHARGYGLFAVNPFGLHDFLNDKTADGSKTLEAGQSMRFRYRVIIHPGDAAAAHIAEKHKQYAAGH
ncbi:MAG: PmoA family protein [Candidatus Solibacter usitatus]|nr:PmoA family protein [Candidatus Solibacter usitatus]